MYALQMFKFARKVNQSVNVLCGMAVPLGYVPKEDIFYAVKAVVAAQRDYGRRDDRKQVFLRNCLVQSRTRESSFGELRSVMLLSLYLGIIQVCLCARCVGSASFRRTEFRRWIWWHGFG